MAAVPLEVHFAFDHPGPLQRNERLAHRGGTLTERVGDLAPEALPTIGSQLAALVGEVLEDPAAQR